MSFIVLGFGNYTVKRQYFFVLRFDEFERQSAFCVYRHCYPRLLLFLFFECLFVITTCIIIHNYYVLSTRVLHLRGLYHSGQALQPEILTNSRTFPQPQIMLGWICGQKRGACHTSLEPSDTLRG